MLVSAAPLEGSYLALTTLGLLQDTAFKPSKIKKKSYRLYLKKIKNVRFDKENRNHPSFCAWFDRAFLHLRRDQYRGFLFFFSSEDTHTYTR